MARQAERHTVTPPVGRRIREAQSARGLTNDQLAREIDVTVRLVQRWRAGTVVPSLPNLHRLSETLDRPVAWFFTDDEAAA